jgi:geranylgeranyl pyrophosphate synthase
MYMNQASPEKAALLRRAAWDQGEGTFLACQKLLYASKIDQSTKQFAEALSQSAIERLAQLFRDGKLHSAIAIRLLEKLAIAAVRREG